MVSSSLPRLNSSFRCFDKPPMRLKSPAIAALAYLAMAGVPAYCQEVSAINKHRVIAYYAKEECWIRNGLSQKQSDLRTLDYQKRQPELKSAIEWVLTSSNGKAAVKRITPFFDSNCMFLITVEEAVEMISPYIK